MQLNEEEIKEFKELYKKEFKEEIDDKTACIMAERLLNLFKAVYGNITEQDYEYRNNN